MADEEQMRRARIGGLRPLNGPIQLVEYSPDWPSAFLREASTVRAALGNSVLELEHVGSTSIPRLASKPIIDMVLVVADSADEKAYVPAMEAAGYILRIREPEWYEHRLFKGPDANINLHVFSKGCLEIERMLLFRDYLRSNDADRALYERTKLFLAADKLRKNLEPSDYKHVALGLIFLKHISNAFEAKRAALLAEDATAAEDPDEYLAENVFWVPKEARWPHLQASAKRPHDRQAIDEAMTAIEVHNPGLKGLLPKDYNRPALDKVMLGELIDLVSGIA